MHPKFNTCPEAYCYDVALIILKDPITTIEGAKLAPQPLVSCGALALFFNGGVPPLLFTFRPAS